MSKEALMRLVTMEMAMVLREVEQICRDNGLARVTLFTAIARDPEDEQMTIIATNEPDLDETLAVAQRLVDQKLKGRPPV